MDEYWQRQTRENPLFPDLLWSRPENRRSAGKLLIIGGNAHGFAVVAEAYAAAEQAGAGTVRVLLPEALRKTVGHTLEAAEFAASTQVSGSFARDSLGELLLQSQWADAVLLAGDLGRNSETAVALEGYVKRYSGPLVITKDAADYFIPNPEFLADRADTVLVISLAQLQKLGTSLKFETPFLLSMGLLLLVQALRDLTLKHSLTIVTKELDQIVVATAGSVSTTKLETDQEIWRVATATRSAVWLMQNPSKPFEAITTSLAVY